MATILTLHKARHARTRPFLEEPPAVHQQLDDPEDAILFGQAIMLCLIGVASILFGAIWFVRWVVG